VIALLTGIAVMSSWWKFGRRMTPVATLAVAPLYVVWKLPIYAKMLVSREKKWIRTDREGK
jgi:hypothetical protein